MIAVNTDLNPLPRWLAAVLLVAGVLISAVDLAIDSTARGLTIDECEEVCWHGVASYTPYECACHPEPEEDAE